MPWKEVKVQEQRVEFVIRAMQPGANMSELCREFNISRPTGYRWLKRYQEFGTISSIAEYSRRPHHTPTRTAEGIEERVVQLRLQYGWGARKLRCLLGEEGIHLAPMTIHRILRRHHLVIHETKRSSADKRFEYECPNQLWQMDFKGPYKTQDGLLCMPLSIIDDHSRYILNLSNHKNTKGQPVWDALVAVMQTYGVPDKMLMDRGTPWWSATNAHGLTKVTVFLIEQGVTPIHGRVRHPQTQGKVERFHRSLAEYFLFHGHPQMWVQWTEQLAVFRQEYNEKRPHEALDMKVPADRYQPSQRAYQDKPVPWQYPGDVQVTQLNTQGMLTYGSRRYFVGEALAGKEVGYQLVGTQLIVRFRHVYIREIDLRDGRSHVLMLDGQNFRDYTRGEDE